GRGLHHGLLRQLLGVIGVGLAAQNQTAIQDLNVEIAQPAAQTALDMGFQSIEDINAVNRIGGDVDERLHASSSASDCSHSTVDRGRCQDGTWLSGASVAWCGNSARPPGGRLAQVRPSFAQRVDKGVAALPRTATWYGAIFRASPREKGGSDLTA